MGQKRRFNRNLKCFELNEKNNLSKFFTGCMEAVLRGKFIALNVYIKDKRD